MGSTGVNPESISGQDKANTFGLLRFENGSVRIGVYKIHPTERRNDRDSVFTVEIPLRRVTVA